MQVVRAAALGMCFGVRDALVTAQNIASPEQVTILGELVHNGTVTHNLRQRGFRMLDEQHRDHEPETQYAMITAHGMSDTRRAQLLDQGKRIIDTTCPIVLFVHKTAYQLRKDGYFLVMIGKPDHVEVQGVMEDCPNGSVVETIHDVRFFGQSRIGVVCQTTIHPEAAATILQQIRLLNPDSTIEYRETICSATRRRIKAMDELINRVQAIVVVGGRNSNNTRGLAELATKRNIPVWHVENASELRADWFTNISVVGLTAGASTLDRTINEVHATLLTMGREASHHIAEAV